jgi:hypothetical protein
MLISRMEEEWCILVVCCIGHCSYLLNVVWLGVAMLLRVVGSLSMVGGKEGVCCCWLNWWFGMYEHCLQGGGHNDNDDDEDDKGDDNDGVAVSVEGYYYFCFHE